MVTRRSGPAEGSAFVQTPTPTQTAAAARDLAHAHDPAAAHDPAHAHDTAHAHDPEGCAASGARGRVVDSCGIKVMSVLLPVAFILMLELVCLGLVDPDNLSHAGYVLLVCVPVACVVLFAVAVFHFIDRAQQQVVGQNRDLAAANSVSASVQGELGVTRIVDAALRSIITTSGAVEASVTLFATDDRPAYDASVRGGPTEAGNRPRRGRAAPRGRLLGRDRAQHGPGPVVDVPLSTGTAAIGRMQLRLPAGARDADCLAPATLASIGHQLASAIQVAQLIDDLQRRKREGHGFYDVLVQISNQHPSHAILSAVVEHARVLLSSDGAALCLNADATRLVELDGAVDGASFFGAGTACAERCLHRLAPDCPVRSSPGWRAQLGVPVRGPVGTLGDLWIGRKSEVPFTERDRTFLVTLSGLAEIALANARMRENERQGAILAERERIAREMHDSLAQVLGVTHLRLRALDSRAEVCRAPRIAAELAELADICEEAYRDVREAILGLRESSRADRGLLESLHAYVEKYSHQSGIHTQLETPPEHDLVLSPRCEVQVIRVIQEALTNVRKHSGATSAVVRIVENEDSTTFLVEDDGAGFDPDTVLPERDGFGLRTMCERMALLNGSLTVDSVPGRGTRVVANVPLPHARWLQPR